MSDYIANEIFAEKKSLAKILNEERFKIGDFQREYSWKRKHIEDLISDLAISFLGNYKEGDGLEKYDEYDNYYMGPIVVCKNHGSLSIVDGQQRLTSLTLLLLYLNEMQKELQLEKPKKIDNYLYVHKGGKTSLILDIDTRKSIMDHLYKSPTEVFEEKTDDESVRNIIDRYEDISKLFPEDIKKDNVLPLFIEWLLYKVILVEVKAFSMENAYSIFETMNDRGLNLSPTEMLKGYLLSKIEDETKSSELNELWRKNIASIRSKAGPDGDLGFFRAWLRAKYADTIRQSKQGAANEDFEIIGTQFHAWVRNNSPAKTHLKTAEDHYFFLQSDFDFFSTLYELILSYRKYPNEARLDLYITNFYTIADSLSYPLYLAPLTKLDDNDTIQEKIKLVANFLDVYTNLRVILGKAITQSSIRYSMYELVKSIRNTTIESLKTILSTEISKSSYLEMESFSTLHAMDNWGYYHYFYARIIYFLDGENIGDFKDLLRNKKQSSFVLIKLFESDEVDEGFEGFELDMHLQSVAGHCLVRRNDYYAIYDTRISAIKKINKLIKLGYFPEMDIEKIEDGHILEFINLRDQRLNSLVHEMWGFN